MPEPTTWRDRRLTWRMAVIAVGALATIAAAASCTAEATKTQTPAGPVKPSTYDVEVNPYLYYVEVQTPTRTVPCILADEPSGTGISCDWEAK